MNVMIKFFTNRDLSSQMAINLARWKRWSREFLPPDPLGGMQSGYARQYNPDDAFTVYLGGHLVSELKYAIPEARQILGDLRGWLADKGFCFDIKGNAVFREGVEALVKKYIIFIHQAKSVDQNFAFCYIAKGIISKQPSRYKGFEVVEELYTETSIGLQPDQLASQDKNIVNTLNITEILDRFVTQMDLDRDHYPALSLSLLTK
jgi:hypothetical protein